MAEAEANETKKRPVCLIVLGMAGSGKTSLVQRLSTIENKPYIVNMDPACLNLPYFANIGNVHLCLTTLIFFKKK